MTWRQTVCTVVCVLLLCALPCSGQLRVSCARKCTGDVDGDLTDPQSMTFELSLKSLVGTVCKISGILCPPEWLNNVMEFVPHLKAVSTPATHVTYKAIECSSCCPEERSRLVVLPKVVASGETIRGTALTRLPSQTVLFETFLQPVLDARTLTERNQGSRLDKNPNVWQVSGTQRFPGNTTYSVDVKGLELTSWMQGNLDPLQRLDSQVEREVETYAPEVELDCYCVSADTTYDDIENTLNRRPVPAFPTIIDIPLAGGVTEYQLAASDDEGDSLFYWVNSLGLPEDAVRQELDPFSGVLRFEVVDPSRIPPEYFETEDIEQEVSVCDLAVSPNDVVVDETGKPLRSQYYGFSSETIAIRFVNQDVPRAIPTSATLSRSELSARQCSVEAIVRVQSQDPNAGQQGRRLLCDIVRCPNGWFEALGQPKEEIVLEPTRQGGIWEARVDFECPNRGGETPCVVSQGSLIFEFEVYELGPSTVPIPIIGVDPETEQTEVVGAMDPWDDILMRRFQAKTTFTLTLIEDREEQNTNTAPELQLAFAGSGGCNDSRIEQDGRPCQRLRVSVYDADLAPRMHDEVLNLSARFLSHSQGILAWSVAEGAWEAISESESSIEVSEMSLARELAIWPIHGMHSAIVEVKVCDKAGQCVSETVRIASNSSPMALIAGFWVTKGSSTIDGQCASVGPYRFTMEPDWYEAGCLQFRDLDGDPLTFRISQMPRFGTVNLTASGGSGNYFVTVMYEINREKMLACHRARTNLIDQLTVQARDPFGGVAEAQMNLNFEVVNTPPTCVNDAATTPVDVPVTIDVLANDSDPDEDVLTIVEVSTPAGGGASVVNDEIVYTPDPNVCGQDTFSYTVDDDYGGQATGWVTVDVTDTVPPVAVCQSGTVSLGSDGTAVLDPAVLDGGSTDNCAIAGYDATEKTFDCSMLGDRPVMLTVYDGAGNADACWATVTVLDEIDPTAMGQDITVQLDESGCVTVQATQIDGGSTDNCGIAEFLIDGATEKVFSCANLGPNLVTLTVRDSSGNEHSVAVTVTVEDTIPPIAQCQDLIASLDINGEVRVAASSIDGGSTDNCGIVSMTLDRNTFTEADIGDQTVTLTVEDASGNTDVCTAVITVQDNLAPDISCPGSKVVQADTNRCYATEVDLGTPTATDNTEVDWATLTNSAPSQFPMGTTAVKWSVSDLYGNVGSCFQQVTVTEPVDPTVSCPGDINVDTTDPTGTTVTFSASATDNCDPSPEISFSPASGSNFPIGDTVVTCAATDDSGNTGTCTFTVSVTFQNSPPNAVDDDFDMQEGGGCQDFDVLDNDSDPEGHDLTITSVGSPQCGTTAIVDSKTKIRYCTESCFDPPDEVTFIYTITDGYDEYDTATVTVTLPGGPIITEPHD